MDTKDLIKKAIEDAIFLLNDEFESVISKETEERYEDVLNGLEKALNILPKFTQRKNRWKNLLN